MFNYTDKISSDSGVVVHIVRDKVKISSDSGVVVNILRDTGKISID